MKILKKITFGILFIMPFIMTMATSVVWSFQYFFNGMMSYDFSPFPSFTPGMPVINWLTNGGWQLVIITIIETGLIIYVFTREQNFLTSYWNTGIESMSWKQMLIMTLYSTISCVLLSFSLTGALTPLTLGANMAIGMYKIGLR